MDKPNLKPKEKITPLLKINFEYYNQIWHKIALNFIPSTLLRLEEVRLYTSVNYNINSSSN